MNISLITVIFLSSLTVGRPPFAVIHLLWMNLIMDTFAAVALCSEPPFEEAHTEGGEKKEEDEAEKKIKNENQPKRPNFQ